MIPHQLKELEIICPAQDRAWLADAPQCLIELLEWNDIMNAELTMTAREISGSVIHAS